jgi:hypothetical protein
MSAGAGRRAAVALGPGLLLAALLALAFHGVLAGRLFYLRDVTQNHVPVRQVVTARIASGSLPLWDPLHGGGTPLLANPNHLVLHPITLLFLALPFDRAFTASILLQFALLAWGGYLLARALPVGRAPAALAAVVLALSGPSASVSSQQNVLSAWAWVPLALWGWLRMIDTGRRRDRVVAVLGCAVVLGCGEVASAATLLTLGLVLAVSRPLPPSGEPHRPGPLALAGSFAGVLLLAALVASVQMVPAAALLRLSPRAGGLPLGEALKWPLVTGRLPELVLPGLLGDPTRLAPTAWWGRWLFEGGYPFLLSAYVGALPCLLAVAALGAGRERRRALALAGVVVLFVVLALGDAGVIYPILRGILPPLRQVRYPERFLLGAVAALALLAATGLERLMLRRSGSRAAIMFGGAAGAVFLVATVLAARPTLADPVLGPMLRLPLSFVDSEGMAVVRGAVLRSTLWMFAEIAALAAGAFLIARDGRRVAGACSWGLVAACGLSLAAASAPARSTAASGWLSTPSPLHDVIARGPDAPRIVHLPRPADLSVWARTDEQIWGYRFDRFTYSLLTGHPDGVPTILDAATDRMDLAGPAEIGRRLPSLPIDDQVRILRIAHAGILMAWAEIHHPDLEPGPVLEDLSRPPLRIYRVRGLPQRARFVSHARRPADPGDPVASLTDRAFDPDDTVLLDGAVEGDDAGPAASVDARVLQDDPEKVRISVEAPRHGWVVLADSFAPGWSARVDGQPADLLRADLLFRAVEVPYGRHEVEMIYRPASVFIGAGLSACGLALLGIWVARPRQEVA